MLEVVVIGVADDTDHLIGLFAFREGDMAEGDVPSDGVSVPEAIASSGLVNDCDTGAGLVVC